MKRKTRDERKELPYPLPRSVPSMNPPAPYLLENTGGAGSFPLWYRLGKSAAEGTKLVLLLVLLLVLGADPWEWDWDCDDALGVG
jgi:hypothetical protein